ncbi:cell wall-binding repeat-containing protein [Desulfosporosinus sp.]|uniref:cell wall-binding repeat-containing protein n=1 Tax=Desulfosporosinus sp. TaxID=157907 RepID=UPI0025C48594|nr:cell wall-binding repeat-containing protein [Desulfosporosinus sp.]MBC2724464.1 cell wall-binding repeat-containing protein [Desulfosporosinus sp.]MBC2728986.1 cell wall-binding repeat-containing protein [Desulfosporosinus sp.]
MNVKIVASILILCTGIIVCKPALAADDNLNSATNSPQIVSINRLSGNTKYETARVISEYYASGKVKNVILSTGNEFADALSASVLAHEKEAPILLVDFSADRSNDAFDYILQHLDSNGTVYIIGGAGIIGEEFETKLYALGIQNVVRIAGMDRYETSYKVASSLNDVPTTTVVISSGEHYPDALSISGFAANKGWPILLSPHDALPQDIKTYLQEKKPSKVYITGGSGAISDDVAAEINGLLPEASVERLTGLSRFDTNALITETFAPNPSTVYLASGYGFADALAGSTLAAKNGDPIIFIDPSSPTLPKSAVSYFGKLYENNIRPKVVSLGGSVVVSNEIMKNTNDLILGTVKETSIYSIDDSSVTVTQNENYSLPKTVPAKLYNSEIMELPVKWDPTFVDTSILGERVYNGVVEGYAKLVKLNLTIKEPEPILIAQYSTHFDSNQVMRTGNIRLAAKALDGKLLAPRELFSFNDSVGQRTAEAGYQEAMIIEGKTFVPGLGGGVCQVSSNLYNAVALANLEIIERHRHSLLVNYVPPGQDATVAFPVLDFKFRNSTNKYLLIRSFVEGNTLTFKLYEKIKN